MNLLSITKSMISTIVPRRPISISLYTGQTLNSAGIATVTRTTVNNIVAHVELADIQRLEFIDGINLTKIHKDFYIERDELTGLNRNLNTGGDYIIADGLYYRIVQVIENYKVGWVHVVGEESTSIEGA